MASLKEVCRLFFYFKKEIILKKLITNSLFLFALLGSGLAVADDYVRDSDGEIYCNSFDECWRGAFFDPRDVALEDAIKCNDAEVISHINKRTILKTKTLEDVVLFNFDKDNIRDVDLNGLKAVKNMGTPIRVEAHTDLMGSDEYNQDLSERRAKRVGDFLGVSDTVGYGETKPLINEQKPILANRRADVIVEYPIVITETVEEVVYK